MREEIIGNCRLILGDCLEILASINKINHVITDPPYEKEAHRSMRRTHESIKTGVNVDLDFSAITEDIRQKVCDLTTPMCQGWSMFFCQAEAVGAWRDCFESAGAKYKRSMIWVKPDASPQFNGQMPSMGYESITLAWCGQGMPKWNGGGKRGVFTHLTNQPDRDGTHQTEKPLPLMLELVTLFSSPGDTVLDPFMGSGTTLAACARSGRHAIGMEISERYFDVACKRVSDAYKQGDFFVDRPKIKQASFI